jgi:hypothetical protein
MPALSAHLPYITCLDQRPFCAAQGSDSDEEDKGTAHLEAGSVADSDADEHDLEDAALDGVPP